MCNLYFEVLALCREELYQLAREGDPCGMDICVYVCMYVCMHVQLTREGDPCEMDMCVYVCMHVELTREGDPGEIDICMYVSCMYNLYSALLALYHEEIFSTYMHPIHIYMHIEEIF